MDLYNSKKAELVAIYGRRRVGKTYLVDETFKGNIAFRHAGLSPIDDGSRSSLSKQLKHFYYSLRLQGLDNEKIPKSWIEAFYLLEKLLQSKDDGTRQIVFLDELPWLDTPRSGFITAFEGFWNTWGSHRNNLMVIVCGSANSWILDNLINNHGGLYNRVTYEIKLSPFTLRECEEFFKANSIMLSRYDIAQSYMIFGGIPYYLGYFQKGMSLAQNVDSLLFAKASKLQDEYSRLFASIFNDPERMKEIIELLGKRNSGYTRKEIIANTRSRDGGTITKSLNALIASDFIIKYVPFGVKRKEEHYKLIDPFCLFYLHFFNTKDTFDENYWQNNQNLQSIVTWRGYAFENVCFNHINQIKKALGINGIATKQSAWFMRTDEDEGTQIDLLIERRDNVINMCEEKFYSSDFTIDKNYHKVLVKRQELLSKEISPKVAIHTVLITTYGLTYNEYSGDFLKVITLDDLFND